MSMKWDERSLNCTTRMKMKMKRNSMTKNKTNRETTDKNDFSLKMT